MENMDKLFSDIIGQEKVKKRLLFELEGFKHTGFIDNLMIIGASGNGKTTIAKEVGKYIYKIKKEKGIISQVILLNGAELQSVDAFFEKFIAQVGDGHVCFLADEFHSISSEFCNALLTILSPNKEHFNVYNHNGTDYAFDLRKISWIAITSELQKVFKPLRSRFSQIFLEDPSSSDLGKIINQNTKFQIENDALNELSSYCRGEGRKAFQLGQEIDKYCNNYYKSVFLSKDVKKLVDTLNYYKNGINQIELETLRHLNHGPCSLGQLAAKTGQTKPAQQEHEMFLQRLGYMTIESKRKITCDGIRYLKEVEQ